MLFDKDKMNMALDNISSNYRKIVLVNLTTNTYQPITIADDELQLIEDNGLDDKVWRWEWFCNSNMVHDDDREACKNFKIEPNSHLVYRRKFNDDTWHWFLLEVLPARDYSEKNKSLVLYVRDIHNIYKIHYETIIDQIGTTDPMTGLLNKFAFERDKTKHEGEKIGVIFADLNGLKYVNDNMGHDEGDKLIVKLANLLKINFPNYSCYHISGDEFIIAAYNQSLQEFLSNALAFHKSIWTSMDTPIASIGYSIGEAGIDSIEKTVKTADLSMQDDKMMFYQQYPQYRR